MRFLVASLLLGSVLPVAAFAQATNASMPALQVTKPIYAWKSEHDSDKKTGKFNHCLVKNMYDNGTVLMIAENNDGVKRIALNFPQSKMTTGEHFDLTAQVDKRDLFPVEAIAVSAQILTIGIPDALPDQMRKGQALYLRGPNDEVVYTLDGMDGAVTALQDCVTTQKGGVTTLQTADTGQTPPPATPTASEAPASAQAAAPQAIQPIEAPAQAQTASPAPVVAATTSSASTVTNALKNLSEKLSGEKKIEVMQEGAPPTVLPAELDAIFSRTTLQPTTFITTPEKNKSTKRPLDYAWAKGDLFVGTKEQNAVPAAGLDKSALYYLKLLKERCTGPFVAETGSVAGTKDVTWLVAEAACSPGKKDDTISALLFATDSKHLRVYFVEAPAAKGAEAIKARDSIVKAIKQ